MKYREEEPSLRFGSPEEAEAFHLELTALVREVMVAASTGVREADQAVANTREVFGRYKTVARALNSMRRSLPRHGQ